jgi:hypothetical protein
MSEKRFYSPDEIPAIAVDCREHRGFFQLDDELVEDSSLTIYDRAVYMVIVKHATRTGAKAGQAKLLNSTIAKTAGCSSRQVRVSLARLKTQKQPVRLPRHGSRENRFLPYQRRPGRSPQRQEPAGARAMGDPSRTGCEETMRC